MYKLIYFHCFIPRKIEKYMKIHTKPYYSHLSIYSFGLLVGIILNSKTVKIKKAILISGWCVSIVLMSIVIFLPYPYINQINVDHKDMMILQSVLPFLWALGIAWVCVVCTTGYGGIVNRFLSLKPFVILNRLIVWIYILHVLVILYIFGKARKAQMISDLDLWMVFSFVMFLTLIASFLFYTFIEAPVSYLISKMFALSTSKTFLVTWPKRYDIQTRNSNL
ncbi:nose resistant to fluoxetine protein 6-like [Centruroides vittatus]|uniref:nose resistant to fluoxetine protein 6-like n=1 Tax=Centruroides vittatus TaxID=120091 RepID=UPI00351050A4